MTSTGLKTIMEGHHMQFDGQTRLFNTFMAVNRSFFNLPAMSLAEKRIFEGVMILDEYRLYDHWSKQFPVTNVIDVGGHCGSFTRMVKAIWPECSVVAYEPTPTLADRFRDNVAGMTGVTLHEAAAVARGDARNVNGVIGLYECKHENTGGNTTHARSDGVRRNVAARVMIDDIMSVNERVSILKLDCEGDEGGLLHDLLAAGWLSRVQYICGEWHGQSNAEAVERVLSATHLVEVCRGGDLNIGAFFANRRQ